MSHRFHASRGILTLTLAVVIAAALLIPSYVTAQAQQAATKAPAQAWTKKTPDGQPDLQGIWSTSTGGVQLERNVNCGTKEFFTPAELALPAAQRCPGTGTAAAAAAPAGRGGAGGGAA